MHLSHKAHHFIKISLLALAFLAIVINLVLTIKLFSNQSELEQLINEVQHEIDPDSVMIDEAQENSGNSNSVKNPPSSQGNSYYVDACHLSALTDPGELGCTTEVLTCTLELQSGDYCQQFVSCSNTGTIQKTPQFQTCFDCFAGKSRSEISEECFAQFPDHFLNI